MSRISNNVILALFLTLYLNFGAFAFLSVKDKFDAENLLSSDDAEKGDPNGNIWAVLIAGSNDWWNYRHQADIAHAYHILRNHGVPAENIITMMYDDIANNEENPYPGEIFNHPEGKDVYAGVKIDYTGKSVSPANFMAVLTGNISAVNGGNKRVLNSSISDNVFIYFADHGGPGMIGFPDYDILSVKSLTETLVTMKKNKLYKKLVFYMEACESGSMFPSKRLQSMNIYAVTAANAEESSWASYCYTKLLPDNCLGDEFSVNWMEHSDRVMDLMSITLDDQFEAVKNLTVQSHVQNFGNMKMGKNLVSEYQGNVQFNYSSSEMIEEKKADKYASFPTFDVPLEMLKNKHQKALGRVQKASVARQIDDLLEKRAYLKAKVNTIVEKLVKDPSVRQQILTTVPRQIEQFDCHHEVVHAFNRHCFRMSEYVLKYGSVLANLCEFGLPTEQIKKTFLEQCADNEIEGKIW